jgi:hypothetical protein
VITAKTLSGSYGRYVVVDHGNGYSSLYGHLNAIVATVGQYVDQGDLIGYLGTSGNSTGPHLHFEERRGGAYFPPYFHRATFHINSSIVSANCSDRPVVGDWNGDGTSDLGIFRNTAPAGFFYQHVGAATAVRWGHPGDAPVEGDFDGDHVTQIGVRALAGGSWYLRSRDATISVVPGVGNASDMPLTGDWDGNGRANLGYYHPSTHAFYLRSDQGTYSVTGYGALGDRPIVGDWNHDGKDEIGLFRPSNATFYLRVPASRSFSTVRIAWAMAGDIPLVGDWNGDGTDELGVWRPSTARFYMRRTSSLTGPAVTTSLVWGAAR